MATTTLITSLYLPPWSHHLAIYGLILDGFMGLGPVIEEENSGSSNFQLGLISALIQEERTWGDLIWGHVLYFPCEEGAPLGKSNMGFMCKPIGFEVS